VKMAEFLLLQQPEDDSPVVWIVEAKSSSPWPQSQADFDNFIEEIRQKLSNALSLGRHPAAEVELSDIE